MTAILNASGSPVVTYTYDAWGKPLTVTGSLATTLGTHNPLRYRGYVYDTETELYYLQSRYYNPGHRQIPECGRLHLHRPGLHRQQHVRLLRK